MKKYYNRVFWFVVKSIGDTDAAKDIVQDCYLKLWQEGNKVDEDKVKAWLFAVAHNSMINYLKKKNRSVSLELPSHPEPWVAEKMDFDVKEIISKRLEALPYIQKSVILLRDLEGYDYKEISTILNLSMEQVKVYLFRGRQKMKNLIKDLKVVL